MWNDVENPAFVDHFPRETVKPWVFRASVPGSARRTAHFPRIHGQGFGMGTTKPWKAMAPIWPGFWDDV